MALTSAEREAVSRGRWFAALPPLLRHELLRAMEARSFRDGQAIFARGEAVTDWLVCAAGAVRLGHDDSRRPFTLAFVAAGRGFGEAPLAAQQRRAHHARAHGDTTVLALSREKLRALLERHPELYGAIIALQAIRLRQLFSLVEDFSGLGLRARVAKQLAHLMRQHGHDCGGEVRLAIRLRQDQLAELLGCSRQRVNQQLAFITRERVIRCEAGCLVIADPERLEQLAAA